MNRAAKKSFRDAVLVLLAVLVLVSVRISPVPDIDLAVPEANASEPAATEPLLAEPLAAGPSIPLAPLPDAKAQVRPVRQLRLLRPASETTDGVCCVERIVIDGGSAESITIVELDVDPNRAVHAAGCARSAKRRGKA
jgi:hypothetical protein